ncbi:TetR/AcrR family transcriptional regulator [Nocardiopsis rhodophaea]|uniref:TetR/AcrR family transcriptional regulator n=1 Tax=Nocardiopsis rhodophaea TaxID=280238 RepID=UPI0031E1C125
MPADNAPTSRSRRSERARRAILDATYDLVLEKGYAKLTIEAIAARAGVGKQTIYRWWPSKGAVMIDAFLPEGAGEETEVDLPDTGDLAADLKAVLRATADEFADPAFSARLRALSAEILLAPELAPDVAERVLGPGLRAYKRRLLAAQREGAIAQGDDVDLDVAVELLLGPLHYRWLHDLGGITHDYVDTLVDFTLAALRPGATSTSSTDQSAPSS